MGTTKSELSVFPDRFLIQNSEMVQNSDLSPLNIGICIIRLSAAVWHLVGRVHAPGSQTVDALRLLRSHLVGGNTTYLAEER